MTAERLMQILSNVPFDTEVRFACTRDDNPHNDYYDVVDAYLMQGFDPDLARVSALYLHSQD